MKRVSESKELVLTTRSDGSGTFIPAPEQKVVDEDTYLNGLERIIQRDFFPELPKLRLQNEWIDAVKQRDLVKMMQIRAEYNKLRNKPSNNSETPCDMTPLIGSSGQTPNLLKTPNLEPSSKRRKLTEYDDQDHQMDDYRIQLENDSKTMTLDQFTTKYTSEDDASFSKLLQKESALNLQKYGSISDSSVKLHQKLLEQGSSGQSLITWKQFDPQNSLMYIPQGIHPSLTANEMSHGEKAIRVENTRFSKPPNWKNRDEIIEKDKQNQTDAAGFKIPHPKSSSSTGEAQNLDAELYRSIVSRQKAELDEPSKLFSFPDTDSRHVSGYKFVSTPLINPNNVDQSPLITWGEIDDVLVLDEETDLPLNIVNDGAAPSNTSFMIPELSERQKVASELAKKATLKKKTTTNVSQSPLLNSPALRSGIFASPGLKSGFDPQLRASYTPVIKSHGVRTPLATPKATPKTPHR